MKLPTIDSLGAKRSLVWLSGYPLVWTVLFYAFVLRARMQLGHWPSPYQPDPKALGFNLHHGFLECGLMALIPLGIVATFLSFLPPASGKARWVGLYWGMIALLFLLARWDPGSFFEWFAD